MTLVAYDQVNLGLASCKVFTGDQLREVLDNIHLVAELGRVSGTKKDLTHPLVADDEDLNATVVRLLSANALVSTYEVRDLPAVLLVHSHDPKCPWQPTVSHRPGASLTILRTPVSNS